MEKNLEDEPSCTKQDITSTDQLVAGVLPRVGSTIPVQYKVDPNGDAVATEWQILGYNASIPSRIRYKSDSGNIVYVSTTSSGLLADIANGTAVYADKTTETQLGTVSGTSGVTKTTTFGGSHTYGNLTPYDAPTTVTVNGTVYTFAGYNVTIQSRAILGCKYSGTVYYTAVWNNQNFSNAWSDSWIRSWMNQSGAVSGQTWYDKNWSSGSSQGNIVGLLSRLPETDFLDSIVPTVNRTWVHSFWRNGKTISNEAEHVVDRFWALGNGNVNYNPLWLKDYAYDTSVFSSIFPSTAQTSTDRIRYLMNEDGSIDFGSAWHWWLRSAISDGSFNAGAVFTDGGVNYSDVSYYNGLLPVCTIG